MPFMESQAIIELEFSRSCFKKPEDVDRPYKQLS